MRRQTACVEREFLRLAGCEVPRLRGSGVLRYAVIVLKHSTTEPRNHATSEPVPSNRGTRPFFTCAAAPPPCYPARPNPSRIFHNCGKAVDSQL